MRISDILIQPKISEKAMKEAQNGKYTFIVNPKANSKDIKYALKEIYNVESVNVHLINTHGGKRRNIKDRKQFKFLPKVKKAIILLSKGQSIDIYDVKDNA